MNGELNQAFIMHSNLNQNKINVTFDSCNYFLCVVSNSLNCFSFLRQYPFHLGLEKNYFWFQKNKLLIDISSTDKIKTIDKNLI